MKKDFSAALKTVLFAALLIFCCAWCGFSPSVLARRGGQFFSILRRMFPPDWSYLPSVLFPLWQTLCMSAAGTLAGAAAAFAAAPFCSAAVTGRRVVPAALRAVVNVVRTVPVLVIALCASFWLGTGTLTGAAAIALYSFGILCRLGWEAMDLVPPRAMETLAASGCGRGRAFVRSVLVQVAPGFLVNTLYVLEANVRHAAILGYAGAGGLGLLLNEKLSWREYGRAGTILVLLYLAVVLIETLAARWRAILAGTANFRRGEKALSLSAFVLLLAASAAQMDASGATAAGFRVMCGIFSGLFHPDAELLFGLSEGGVPFLMLETLCMAFAGTALGAAAALPFAFLGCRRIFGPFAAALVRLFSAALRTVPAVVYGLLFIRVAGPGPFAGLLTFTALSAGMCVKLFSGSLDELDGSALEALRVSGCGRCALLRHALWPPARAPLAANALYRFDVNVREASVMGLVGAGGIGAPLIFAMNNCNWPAAGACLIGLTAAVFAADAVSSRLRKR